VLLPVNPEFCALQLEPPFVVATIVPFAPPATHDEVDGHEIASNAFDVPDV
jgi:hypothetical protein